MIPFQPNSDIVYSATVAPGAGMGLAADLSAVATKNRPRGWWRYVTGLLYTVTFTPVAGNGATDLLRRNIWRLLSQISLELRDLRRLTINSMSSHDIVQMLHSMDILSNAQVTAMLGPDITVQESNVQASRSFYVPFAPRFASTFADEQKLTGAIPMSQFIDGRLQTAPISSATIQANWTIGNVQITCRVLSVDVPHMLPWMPAYLQRNDLVGSSVEIPRGDRDCRLLDCVAVTTDDTDLTDPTSFSLAMAGDELLTNRTPATHRMELQNSRITAINDGVHAVSLPLISSAGASLESSIIFSGRCQARDVFANQANSGRLLSFFLEELTPSEQITVQMRHGGADIAQVTKAVNDMHARKTRANFALIDGVLASAVM